MKNLIKLCICTLVMMSGCMVKQNTLYIGTNAEFPPFESLEGKEIVGFDIDLIKALAKEMQTKIEIKNFTWEGLLPALQGKKIDMIIAGMSITPDRQKIVNFTDTYYTSREQMIITHETNTQIRSMEDFVGKKIGVVLGFTGDTIVSAMDGVEIERFNNAFQAIMDLKVGKINAILLDYEPAHNFAKTTRDIKLLAGNNSQEEYSIALRKEDSKLVAQLNKALKTIKQNGTYDEIYKKYFE